jgi:lysophospholipase L1-like esterase
LIRRLLIWAGALLLLFAAVLAGEIFLALRRDYLPTDAPLELNRTFGPREATPLRFVVLGDSTAAGLGAGDAAHAYPTLLAQRLARETGRRVELTALGVSGAQTADVLNEQVPQVVDINPDLIFVGIGANDVTHLTPLEDIEVTMRQVVSELKATDARLVVAGAPDMRVLAWLEPLRTITYLRGRQVTGVIERVAREEGAAVVELAEETGHYFAAEPDLHFSEDEFHPSPRGYERWADAIFPVLLETLRG